MADKRKQSLRTQLPRGTHEQIIADFMSAMDLHMASLPPLWSGMWGAKIRYQQSQLLAKYVGPDTDPASDRKARAIEKWLATEDRNARTNARLYNGMSPKLWRSRKSEGHITVEHVIDFARRVILKVLGQEPSLQDLSKGSFTGGASTRHKRGVGTAARKFTGQADVTKEAWPFVLPLLVANSGWLTLNPEVLNPRFVEGNVMFTVPKSTSIDRVAAKEPDLNMFAQKACGDLIRRRLKSVGIDLNDQSINQDLAREGSTSGKLATIDLSSASDSVSTSLVARLLPPGWFVLLDAIRCKRTVIGDEVHENHMFSSMGNGFTFELESLIFWALARSIAFHSGVKGRISIYGDDIIVPSEMARRLARTFLFFGFSVNSAKSFWTGAFRESCGYHGWYGFDITPIYVKEPIQDMERLVHFLNRLRRWSASPWDASVCESAYWAVWQKWSKLVDSRIYGGDNPADPSRLVSRHKARFKLVRKAAPARRTEQELQLGLYLQALSALSRRKQEVEPPRYYREGRVTFTGAAIQTVLERPTCVVSMERELLEARRWIKVASFPSANSLMRESNTWVLRKVKHPKIWASPMWEEESPHFIP